ncbi:MAG: hypothetical protein E7607_00445 [Ruminococcaceae bacterium]|nr:hypothetical protein [Oscillospiraceae bacterium]
MKARILPSKLMSKKQIKARDEEIDRQIIERDRKFAMENDAMVLWVIHLVHKHGKKRLRRFFDRCFEEHEALRAFYQLEPEEMGWLYTRKLKEIGVDIEAWYAEKLGEQQSK